MATRPSRGLWVIFFTPLVILTTEVARPGGYWVSGQVAGISSSGTGTSLVATAGCTAP